ncbi:MAG: hypothetical protein BWY23_02734 [Spirochaetes bacterium ADurb.Bin218]|nr:MAG: hypothetical protein BWY23_02734 [Spirochaetes bacterium ADurb.Bin218]
MMVRIITPTGYDYIKEDYLGYFIDKGYVLGLAEDIEETTKRCHKIFSCFRKKILEDKKFRRLGGVCDSYLNPITQDK